VLEHIYRLKKRRSLRLGSLRETTSYKNNESVMPFLSAKPLTEDPMGLSRLKAVIATDPGYQERARNVAEAASERPPAQDLPAAEAACPAEAPCAVLTTPVFTPPDPSLGGPALGDLASLASTTRSDVAPARI
jgi:hypothetical protein